jgi:SHS2 domain-containing protein
MIFAVMVTVISILYLMFFVESIVGKRRIIDKILAAVIFLIGYVFIQCFSCFFRLFYYDNAELPDFDKMVAGKFASIPVVLAVGVVLLMIILVVIENTLAVRHYRSRITEQSVKNGLDMLPTGIMYYWRNGIVKLINLRMEEICRNIDENASFDGQTFWTKLYHERYVTLKYVPPKSDNSVTVLTPDNKCYHFMRNEIDINGNTMYELIAMDVTAENAINYKLSSDRNKVKNLNERLKELSDNIGKMTIEREILDTKISVHDNLGEALLLTKQYLTDNTSVDKKEVVSLLKRNIALLENEKPDSWQSSYEECLNVAKLSGVDVVIDGKLPEASESGLGITDSVDMKNIIENAITTCITNVVRHAKGNQLYVSVKESDREYTIKFTNNGKKPRVKIKESGGLKNLRFLVESNGGAMIVISKPEFCLEIILKK